MAENTQVDEFLKLYTGHEVRLRAFATSLLGNHADVEDVLQQSNLALWRKFSQYKPGTSFMAWAGRVVYLEVQLLRRQKARDRVRFGEAFDDAVLRESTREETVAELSDRERFLGECLAKLRPEQREMLRARYDEGSSIERMAELYQRSAQAIHNVLTRIRKALYDCVTIKTRAELRHGE